MATARRMAGKGAARRALRPLAAAVLVLVLAALPVGVRAQEADLALVLAVDASGSVTDQRFALQKQGYVAAFRNPRVWQAVAAGAAQAIVVAMVQWTGPGMQVDVVPWTVVRDRESAEAFAAAVERAPRLLFGGGTSISGAIEHGVALLRRAPGDAARHVIDISGDGANNRGRPAGEARDEAVAAGVTINGLPILNVEAYLDEHYREEVIGGPGAFLIAIDGYDQFAEAILRKLLTEIAGLPGGPENGALLAAPAVALRGRGRAAIR